MRKAKIGSILQLCSIILVFYFMIVLNSAQPADAAQIPKRVIERIETPEIDGGVSEHVKYEYNDGSAIFEIKDGSLYWTDGKEEGSEPQMFAR